MQEFYQKDGLEAVFHAGTTGTRVVLTLAVTNNRADSWTTESGNAAWSSIGLTDSNGTSRLESMGSATVVTSWEIPPGETLVRQRETNTREEAENRDLSMMDMILDSEEYQQRRDAYDPDSDDAMPYFAHHVALAEEQDEEFTAHAQVKLAEFTPSFSFSFTPADLNDAIVPSDKFEVAADPRGR